MGAGRVSGCSGWAAIVRAVIVALSTAQAVFGTALAVVTLIITGFALYVAWSTVWSDRWYEKRETR